MRKNCLLLDINIPFLREDFVFPDTEGLKYITRYRPKDVLTPELIKFFDTNIAEIKVVLLFYQGPKNDTQEIHIDGHGEGDHIMPAINWVLSDNYAMRWYEPRVSASPIVNLTPTNHEYITYKLEDVTLVEETSDPGPWLTEVGSAPHHGLNFSEKIRWCFSVRPNRFAFRDYEDLVNRFSPWIIEERK